MILPDETVCRKEINVLVAFLLKKNIPEQNDTNRISHPSVTISRNNQIFQVDIKKTTARKQKAGLTSHIFNIYLRHTCMLARTQPPNAVSLSRCQQFGLGCIRLGWARLERLGAELATRIQTRSSTREPRSQLPE